MSTSARVKYINAQKLKVCLYILKKETDGHCTHFLKCEMWD